MLDAPAGIQQAGPLVGDQDLKVRAAPHMRFHLVREVMDVEDRPLHAGPPGPAGAAGGS